MEKIPDSEWLASMVAAAYTDGRYDLGEALARLCGQAHRMEQAQLPILPPEPAPEPLHVHELVRQHERDFQVVTGPVDQDPPLDAEADSRPIRGTAVSPVTPSARCVAQLPPTGVECHGVLYWATVSGAPGWMHLNPEMDDHFPVANRVDPR